MMTENGNGEVYFEAKIKKLEQKNHFLAVDLAKLKAEVKKMHKKIDVLSNKNEGGDDL